MRFYKVSNYIVTENKGEYICTCPDFLYRKRECKHIKQIKEVGGEELEVEDDIK